MKFIAGIFASSQVAILAELKAVCKNHAVMNNNNNNNNKFSECRSCRRRLVAMDFPSESCMMLDAW